MRDICFRGKVVSSGEWIEGSLLQVTINGQTAHLIFGDNFSLINGDVKALSHALVDPSTVGQFTGVTDTNGKKIFEGDIINGYTMEGMNDRRGEPVTWSELFSGWYAGKNKSLYGGLGEIYEVIGNIHDNPELLEV